MNTFFENRSDFVSVELTADGDQLLMFGDAAGLQRLRDSLDRLIANTRDGYFAHTHMMTPDWGGDELSNVVQSDNGKVIHHVKLYCVKGNKPQP